MTADHVRDYDQPGWNAGYLCGEQDRTELELRLAERDLHIALLQGVVERAIRYVLQPTNLVDVAARGTAVFGKRWQEITGFKTTPAKDAT